jgi:hypothetical protein
LVVFVAVFVPVSIAAVIVILDVGDAGVSKVTLLLLINKSSASLTACVVVGIHP